MKLWGSSPLARGTHVTGLRDVRVAGLIPARAGNTSSTVRVPVMMRAHPRSRGEHEEGDFDLLLKAGSSPLARGTRNLHSDAGPVRGLIPARAGNTKIKYAGGLTPGLIPARAGNTGWQGRAWR